MFSVIPDLSGGAAAFTPASLSPIFGQLDFSRVFSLDFLVVMFAFLFVDIFDTLGTLIGVSSKANMLDEKRPSAPHQRRPLSRRRRNDLWRLHRDQYDDDIRRKCYRRQ